MAEDIITKLKELKNLPPEERIKRLKEIEEKNKQEIEEAHKLMQESEVEIEEQEKEKEQIPIPQIKAVDIEMLAGEEERRVFATKRYVDPKKKTAEEDERKPLTIDKSLEETIFSEPGVRLSRAQLEEHKQYQIRLANTAPTRDLYSMAGQLMEEVKQKLDERGYLSQQQMKDIETKARDLAYATLYKGQAMQEGVYKGNERTEEMIRKTTDLTKNIMQYIRG